MTLQNQMPNITQFATTMFTLALMSSMFSGITGGITVMPQLKREYTITRDEVKQRAIMRSGEKWPEYMYDDLMDIVARKLNKEVDEIIDFYTVSITSGREDKEVVKPILRRFRED